MIACGQSGFGCYVLEFPLAQITEEMDALVRSHGEIVEIVRVEIPDCTGDPRSAEMQPRSRNIHLFGPAIALAVQHSDRLRTRHQYKVHLSRSGHIKHARTPACGRHLYLPVIIDWGISLSGIIDCWRACGSSTGITVE